MATCREERKGPQRKAAELPALGKRHRGRSMKRWKDSVKKYMTLKGK